MFRFLVLFREKEKQQQVKSLPVKVKMVNRLRIKAVVAVMEIRTIDLFRRGHQFRTRSWE